MDENVAIVKVSQKVQHVTVKNAGGLRGLTGPQGAAGAGLQITGSVDTYADLPSNLNPADAGKAYFVQSDGRLYVWSGTKFPVSGQGSQFVGPQGPAGPAGYSPTASVTKVGNKTTITIEDEEGTTEADVYDGAQLEDGIINGAANNATTVTGSKIALSTIGTPNLRNGAVSTDKIAPQAVDSSVVNWNSLMNRIYPVGSIYMSATLSTPAQVNAALGGTWVAWGAGKVPVGIDATDADFDTVEATGGSKTHKHLMPFLVDSESNFTTFQWNWSASYGSKRVTSPNKYNLNGSPEATSLSGYQLYSSSESSLQPYITCYMYKRIA